MKIKKKISRSNLPTTIPFSFYASAYLMLQHFNAPSFVYWVLGIYVLIQLIWIIANKENSEPVDIFEEKENTK